MVIESLEKVRAAVADGLEARGHGNQQFLREIREGRRDDGPFMIGALIMAQQQALISAE